MNRVRIVGGVVIFAAVTLSCFQNCSGSGASSASSVTAQSQDPQTTLNSVQGQVIKVMNGNPTTVQELQAALQALEQLLAQIQAIDTTTLPPALQQLDQQLIQQLTDDINQLEAQLAALNGGGSCSFNGQTVASGSSVTAYQASSVPEGQTCQSQTRTCESGQLSGSYTFASCSVEAPLATVPVYDVRLSDGWFWTSTCSNGDSGSPCTASNKSVMYYLYSETMANSIPVYNCQYYGGGFPYYYDIVAVSCPSAELHSSGIAGYVSTTQLPNTIQVYECAGYGTDAVYSTAAPYDGDCTPLGWVPGP